MEQVEFSRMGGGEVEDSSYGGMQQGERAGCALHAARWDNITHLGYTWRNSQQRAPGRGC